MFRRFLPIAVLLLMGCASQRPASEPEEAAEPPEEPSLYRGMPRGILHARFTVLETSAQEDGSYVCVVRVDEMLGSGPAAPPMAAGAVIELLVASRFFTEERDGPPEPETALEAYVGYARVLGREDGQWRLVKWFNGQKDE